MNNINTQERCDNFFEFSPINKIYINSYLYDSYRSTDFIAGIFHAFVYNSISLILEERLTLVIESTRVSMHIHSISYFPLSSIFQACHQIYNQFVSLHFFFLSLHFDLDSVWPDEMEWNYFAETVLE